MAGYCNPRSNWILAFLLALVLAFSAHLVAVLTPSWQYVYLEDGRTEHHHGLWLDCKRDYSNDYGRPREYYEKLYRIKDLQGPFDQFFLPAFLCVFKFDYWIDDEDWYEHGYDENRLWGDAYQHLFLGWKIAALTAHCFALLCALSSMVLLLWAFCHRLLICVAAVLVTLAGETRNYLYGRLTWDIAVITSLAGNVIFYMFASYQDNNIIKEEDGIYEQFFGWSFYASVVGNLVLLIAAVIGCSATAAILSSGRTKHVKIELKEGDDNARLIYIQSGSQELDPGRFKRSYSAVYKIDSAALRKWERNAMKSMGRTDFKRTNSMPNFFKKSMAQPKNPSAVMQSTSDISKAFTEPPHQFIPHSQPQCAASSESPEMIYEYVDENSAYNSTLKLNHDGSNDLILRQPSCTTINMYDRVPHGSRTQLLDTAAENDYLKPISLRSDSSLQRKMPSQDHPSEAASHAAKIKAIYEYELYELQQRDKITTSFGIDRVWSEQPVAHSPRPVVPPKPPQRSPHLMPSAPNLTYKPFAQQGIPINTFQLVDNGRHNSRSITNLVDAGSTPVSAFDRGQDGVYESSLASSQPCSSFLSPTVKETSFNTLTTRYAASEMDRSLGGSTFAPNSPDMSNQELVGGFRTMV